MSDKDLIDFLVRQIGNAWLTRLALGGITSQRLTNWRSRDCIPAGYRPKFRTIANRYGAKLPMSWLDVSVPSVREEDRADAAGA